MLGSFTTRLHQALEGQNLSSLSQLLERDVCSIDRIGEDSGFLSNVYLLEMDERKGAKRKLVFKASFPPDKKDFADSVPFFLKEIEFYHEIIPSSAPKNGTLSSQFLSHEYDSEDNVKQLMSLLSDPSSQVEEHIREFLSLIPACHAAHWDFESQRGVIVMSYVANASSLSIEKGKKYIEMEEKSSFDDSPGKEREPYAYLNEEKGELVRLYEWMAILHAIPIKNSKSPSSLSSSPSSSPTSFNPATSVDAMIHFLTPPKDKSTLSYYDKSLQVVKSLPSSNISQPARTVLSQLVEGIPFLSTPSADWWESLRAPRATLSHGDLWSNNLMVNEEGVMKAIIDFQFMSKDGDSGLLDLLIVHMLSLPVVTRRHQGEMLLKRYTQLRSKIDPRVTYSDVQADYECLLPIAALFGVLSMCEFPVDGVLSYRVCQLVEDSLPVLQRWTERMERWRGEEEKRSGE